MRHRISIHSQQAGGTGKQFYNFGFSGTASTLTLSGYDLYVSSNFTLPSGASSFNNSLSSRNVTIMGDINHQKFVALSGRSTWTLFGNWTPKPSDKLSE